jgi:hypothetical protein
MFACRLGDLHALQAAFVTATFVDLSLQVAAGAGFNLPAATHILCLLPVSLFKMYAVVRYGAHFIFNYFWVGGILSHICNALERIFYFMIPPITVLAGQLIIDFTDTLCMLLFAVFRYWRWRTVCRARRLLLADRARYDAVWALVLEEAESRKGENRIGKCSWLLELSAAIDELLLTRNVIPRQLTRRQDDSKLGLIRRESSILMRTLSGVNMRVPSVPNTFSLAFSIGAVEPVKSLDQLYSQAVCIHPILVSKVRCWAAASRGCFKAADGSSSFVDFGEQNSSSGVFERVPTSAWPRREQVDQDSDAIGHAKIKTVARSVEKLVRSYGRVRHYVGAAIAFRPFIGAIRNAN